MGFEDWMEEDGFSDPEEYLNHLASEAMSGELADVDGGLRADIHKHNEVLQSIYFLRKCEQNLCSGKIILKITRNPHRYFWGCSNYQNSRCNNTENFMANQLISANCKKCGAQLIIRFGKKGAFVGCTNYPKCFFSDNLPFSNIVNQDLYKPVVMTKEAASIILEVLGERLGRKSKR